MQFLRKNHSNFGPFNAGSQDRTFDWNSQVLYNLNFIPIYQSTSNFANKIVDLLYLSKLSIFIFHFEKKACYYIYTNAGRKKALMAAYKNLFFQKSLRIWLIFCCCLFVSSDSAGTNTRIQLPLKLDPRPTKLWHKNPIWRINRIGRRQ